MGGSCGTYGRQERCIQFLWGELRERNHLEDLEVDGKIIQAFIGRKIGGEAWHGLVCSGSGQRQVAGTCECGNELSGSVKYWEYFDWLRTS